MAWRLGERPEVWLVPIISVNGKVGAARCGPACDILLTSCAYLHKEHEDLGLTGRNKWMRNYNKKSPKSQCIVSSKQMYGREEAQFLAAPGHPIVYSGTVTRGNNYGTIGKYQK